MARSCSTPAVKGKGKSDDTKGGKGQGKEDRICYNCNKKGHLSKDCWSVKKGKGKGKEVNGLGDTKAENTWMVAGVFANPETSESQLQPTATSNQWEELWSEEEEEEEEEEYQWLTLEPEDSTLEVTGDGEEESYPPGLSGFQGDWEEEGSPSVFDQLFPQQVSQAQQVKEEEFEKIEDEVEAVPKLHVDPMGIVTGVSYEGSPASVNQAYEEWRQFNIHSGEKAELEVRVKSFAKAKREYPSVNGGIFDWDELQEESEIGAVFEINGVDKIHPQQAQWQHRQLNGGGLAAVPTVKIAIDSAAADSVCPANWAEQFPIVEVPVREFVTATGAEIKHSGQKTVALGASVNGKQKTIGMVFQACDVKRPLAAVNKICAKNNIVQFGPGVNDNFIQNISTKEKIWLKMDRGQYVMEASLQASSPF